jgi:hypothetical protein
MQTLLGKILVYVTAVLSVCMCALGVGVYTNRIDWGHAGSPPAIAAGKVVAGKNTANTWKTLAESAGPAVYEARTGQKGLLLAEARRPASQDWYDSQMAMLEGKDANGNILQGPVSELGYDAKGALVFGRDGRPLLKPTALEPRLRVLEDLKKMGDRIAVVLTSIAKLEQSYNTLTVEINGDKQSNRRGLRDFIEEVRAAQAKAANRTSTLQPLTINRRVEAHILKQRQQELNARIKELVSQNGDRTLKSRSPVPVLRSSKQTGVASSRP